MGQIHDYSWNTFLSLPDTLSCVVGKKVASEKPTQNVLTLNTSAGVCVTAAVVGHACCGEKTKQNKHQIGTDRFNVLSVPILGHWTFAHSFGSAPDSVANPTSSWRFQGTLVQKFRGQCQVTLGLILLHQMLWFWTLGFSLIPGLSQFDSGPTTWLLDAIGFSLCRHNPARTLAPSKSVLPCAYSYSSLVTHWKHRPSWDPITCNLSCVIHTVTLG